MGALAARAARPWVNRTALGAPVEPEVKISTSRSSGAGSARMAGARRSPESAERGLVLGRVGDDHAARWPAPRSSPSSRSA